MTTKKSKRLLKAEKAKASAEKKLVYADYWAKLGHPKAKKEAREMRRIAKRLRSKAERRAGRIACSEGT
jgi:hypothetical protein